jgi:hypothetical protein
MTGSTEKNPERNAKIRDMRAKGVGVARIASIMGISRNTAIGVLSRSGVSMDPAELRRVRQAAGRAGGKALDKPVYDPVKAAAGRAASLARIEEEAPALAVVFVAVSGCCWPFGEPKAGLTYCNAPCCAVKVPGLPTPQKTKYCEAHWLKRNATRHTRVVR